MSMRAFGSIVGVALLAVGCGSGGDEPAGGDSTSISSQPLAGVIAGQAWSLKTAKTDAFLSDETTFFVTMYPTVFTACESFAAPTGVNEVILEIPRAAGTYTLSLDRNVTLYEAATVNNLVATRGVLRVDAVTATTISGGLNATYDAGNKVDGKFEATICP